jgi:membrane protein DedA with SNARE-associated domain
MDTGFIDAANVWQTALAGLAAPGAIALALALGTLLLEDLAIAAGVALATEGLISWQLSLLAVGGGIALGDLGLYALGRAAIRLPALRRRPAHALSQRLRALLTHRLPAAVLLARVVPGLRLPVYTACGLLRVPPAPFTIWVLVSVLLWTLALYALGLAFGPALAQRLGLPPALAVALPIVLLVLALTALHGRLSRRRPESCR